VTVVPAHPTQRFDENHSGIDVIILLRLVREEHIWCIGGVFYVDCQICSASGM